MDWLRTTAMELHVPTLFAVIVAISALLCVVIAFIGRRRHADLHLWSVALGLQGLAYALFGARGQFPAWLTVVLANVALSTSLALYAHALLRFRHQRWPGWWVWGPVLLVAAAFAWTLDDMAQRLLTGGLLYGLQLVLIAGALGLPGLGGASPPDRPWGRGQALVLAGIALMTGMIALRVWALLSGRVNVEFIAQGNWLQYATFLSSLAATLLLALGIVIMNEERAEQALQHSEHDLNFRNQILEMLAQGKPLRELMQAIVQGVEALHPPMLCSIVLLDRQGQHLQVGAAPSLPDFFNAAVQGLAVGPQVGSCGAAIHTGQRVVVSDIEHHPNWQPYLELTRRAGLGACWSQPIFASDRRVLGSFGIYHHQPHTPSAADIALIEQSAMLAGIAIERSTAASQLLEREHQYRLLIDTANEGIAVFQQGILRFANPRFFQMCGHPAEELLDRHFGPYIHEDDRATVLELHRRRLAGQAVPAQVPFRVHTRHLGVRWFEVTGALLEWQGQPASLTFFSDITERRELEAKIQQQAYHDSLTDLPNRRLLTHNLTLAMATHQRSGLQGALMFLVLDNFKPLNDSHGHKVGDLLLLEVAQRLKQALRQNDTVARFGGDEFVVLLSDLHTDTLTSTEQARTVAEKLLSALAQPYRLTVTQTDGTVDTVEHRCTASIGAVLFGGQEVAPDELIKQADMAMYRAKQAGRNTVCFDLPPGNGTVT